MRAMVTGMPALAFVMASCASSPTPATSASSAAPPLAAAPPAPTPPIELAQVDHDGERVITWTPDLEMIAPTEDRGFVAYAQRTTPLLGGGGIVLGSLEAGARVGVFRIEGERAGVALFPWGATGRTETAALVTVRDLGPRPPTANRSLHHASTPVRAQRVIRRGQTLSSPDGTRIAWTFCGPVDILGEDAHGTRIAQRDAGITLEGYVDKDVWADRPCPGPLLVDDWNHTRQLITGDRWRGYREPTLPPGLVEAGPFTAPDFASLVAKKTRIWWLFPGKDDQAPSCSELRLEPRPTPRGAGRNEAALVARGREKDGTSWMTRYDVEYWTDSPPLGGREVKGASPPDATSSGASSSGASSSGASSSGASSSGASSSGATSSGASSSGVSSSGATPPGSRMAMTTLILLGPLSESYDHRGKVMSSMSFGCGQDFAIVASDASGLLVHREPPSLNARILAYAPGDTERWYFDKASCEKDLERRHQRVAGGPNGHVGC